MSCDIYDEKKIFYGRRSGKSIFDNKYFKKLIDRDPYSLVNMCCPYCNRSRNDFLDFPSFIAHLVMGRNPPKDYNWCWFFTMNYFSRPVSQTFYLTTEIILLHERLSNRYSDLFKVNYRMVNGRTKNLRHYHFPYYLLHFREDNNIFSPILSFADYI